jgi:hypothetical protein
MGVFSVLARTTPSSRDGHGSMDNVEGGVKYGAGRHENSTLMVG